MKRIPVKTVVAGVIMALQGLSASVYAQALERPPVLVAAGSLKTAMDETIAAYQAQGGPAFNVKYGPSGKLRKEIESGAQVDVFASADVAHTDALAEQKLLGASTVFTHNDLCVIARSELKLNAGNLLDVLSKPSVRMATSTPVSDPMGDYTWQFFKNADKQRAGLYQLLDGKALKLSGANAPVAGAKLPYVTAFEDDKADAYVMYCTNATTTKKSVPDLHIVRIPDALNVRSVYGIAADAHSAPGKDFIRFVLSPAGQSILKKHGFD